MEAGPALSAAKRAAVGSFDERDGVEASGERKGASLIFQC